MCVCLRLLSRSLLQIAVNCLCLEHRHQGGKRTHRREGQVGQIIGKLECDLSAAMAKLQWRMHEHKQQQRTWGVGEGRSGAWPVVLDYFWD